MDQTGQGHPPAEQDGYRSKFEEVALERGKLEDPDFFPSNVSIGDCSKDVTFEWKYLTEIYNSGEIWTQAIGYDTFEGSEFCDWEFLACIEALTIYPSLV